MRTAPLPNEPDPDWSDGARSDYFAECERRADAWTERQNARDEAAAERWRPSESDS